MRNKRVSAVVYALLAAVFYALNTPFSKILLNDVSATFMAAFLYMGAGLGMGIMYLFHIKNEDKTERLTKKRFAIYSRNDSAGYYGTDFSHAWHQYGLSSKCFPAWEF